MIVAWDTPIHHDRAVDHCAQLEWAGTTPCSDPARLDLAWTSLDPFQSSKNILQVVRTSLSVKSLSHAAKLALVVQLNLHNQTAPRMLRDAISFSKAVCPSIFQTNGLHNRTTWPQFRFCDPSMAACREWLTSNLDMQTNWFEPISECFFVSNKSDKPTNWGSPVSAQTHMEIKTNTILGHLRILNHEVMEKSCSGKKSSKEWQSRNINEATDWGRQMLPVGAE